MRSCDAARVRESALTVKAYLQGYGTALFKLGHRYQGQWVGGKMHGQGAYEWLDGILCVLQVVVSSHLLTWAAD